jgi:hypothetical protein
LGTIGGVIGGIGGFIAGGPGGAVAGATAGRTIGDAINGPSGGPPVTTPTGVNPFGNFSGGYGTNPTPGTAVATTGAGDPCAMKYGRGSHLNRHTLQPSKKHGVQPPGTWCVRNRHMHFGNARAATRAIRRLKGAHRVFKKIDKLIGHHRSVRRAPFRKR